MTLDEMIEQLNEYRDTWGGDAEVRMMTQSNYPLEHSIHRLISGAEMNEMAEDDNDVADDTVIYVVEGIQLGYGSKRAWEASNT